MTSIEIVRDKLVDLSNIRAAMAKNKVTGLDLAKILKISQTAVYQKLNGKRKFSADEIGILAIELKTEVNFFYKQCY